MMIEFKVGEHEYMAQRLDAFTQLHIGRRIAPLLSHVTSGGGSFSAIATALSMATQEDVDFVIRSAIKGVKRKSGEAWAPVFNASAGMVAFDDISGLQLLEIVSLAIKDDIAPFFSGLVSLVLGTPRPTSA